MIFTDEIGTHWRTIVVTGPERSGTNIAAKMIAHSLGCDYVPENSWGSDFGKLWAILNTADRRLVVHAPHLTYRVHEIDAHCGDHVLVVFMLRSVSEIVASQRRIGWGKTTGLSVDGEDPKGWGNPESVWFDRPSNDVFEEIIDPSRHLCENRQLVWHLRQKQHVKNLIEVAYESLQTHPLWLDKERRQNFHPHQTEA